MKTMLRWASALCMLSVSTMASAGSLPTGFRVGYNEPWIENYYATWLASNPFPQLFGSSAFGAVNPGMPGVCPTTGGPVNPMFSGMAQGNTSAKIVRIWLFPALQGININTNPNVVTGELVNNLGKVFTLARNC